MPRSSPTSTPGGRLRPPPFAAALCLLAVLPRPSAAADTAPSTVYLCSRAKSMAAVFPQVKTELQQSTAGSGAFDIVFFGGGATQRLSDKLQQPTEANHKKAVAFLDKTLVGTSDGDPKLATALTNATQLKSQAINILLDAVSDADRADAWVKTVEKAVDGGTLGQVNCIYLVDTQAGDPATVAALKKLATAGHGTFKMLLKKDL